MKYLIIDTIFRNNYLYKNMANKIFFNLELMCNVLVFLSEFRNLQTINVCIYLQIYTLTLIYHYLHKIYNTHFTCYVKYAYKHKLRSCFKL